MASLWELRFDNLAFAALTACQGRHVAAVISAIATYHPDLVWYAANVQNIGKPFVDRLQPTPVRVGDARAFVQKALLVDQFESGVFVGVSSVVRNPRFRDGGLWTEDDENADLGDAVVEVRAFDSTYILVASTDAAMRAHLQAMDFAQT